MHPFRNEGGGSWWREDRDDDDTRRSERGGQGQGRGQGQWQGQGQRQGQWQGQGRSDDSRGYGEGRYGQRGGPASDYGEGRYEGRQRHESDVRERGYYGSRESAGGQDWRQERREDWQQAGRRAPWEDDDTWRGSQAGGQGAQGRQWSGGGSVRDEWGDSRTGMYERPGSAGRRAGEPGKDAPGAREQGFGAMRRGRDRIGPKGYQRSDERIREEICERLAHARHVDVRDVEVEVQSGVVRLTGNVQDRREKYCIEEIADDVFGVREIHNALRLGSPGAFGVSGITEGAQGTQGTQQRMQVSQQGVQGTTGTQSGVSTPGRVSGVSSSGSATGSTASSYGAGMETGSGGLGKGRDSTGGTTRI
ncbi:BON domain-containing protein [Cupriavidus necator]|uniref:BON domain-containing protein n=1 Tax=Cupriavidus necator TaxID=106590 RepID=UPI0005B3B0FE|nr:BON domain-containing protein [Cupriavidus necator]